MEHNAKFAPESRATEIAGEVLSNSKLETGRSFLKRVQKPLKLEQKNQI